MKLGQLRIESSEADALARLVVIILSLGISALLLSLLCLGHDMGVSTLQLEPRLCVNIEISWQDPHIWGFLGIRGPFMVVPMLFKTIVGGGLDWIFMETTTCTDPLTPATPMTS